MSPRRLRGLLVAAIASAAPVALALDLLARRLVLAGQPEEVRAFLAVEVTRLAWLAVPGPVLGALVAFWLYPRHFRRALGRHADPAGTVDASSAQRADLEALLLSTTLAQLPALLGDLSVMLGARLWPAICTTSLSTLAVVSIGLFARRSAPAIETSAASATHRPAA